MMLILDPTSLARGLVRKKVEVVNYPDGRFAVQFNGATLGFKVFDKIQTVQPGGPTFLMASALFEIRYSGATGPARPSRSQRATTSPPLGLAKKPFRLDIWQPQFAPDSLLEQAGFELAVPP
jgi:hypothetical protein